MSEPTRYMIYADSSSGWHTKKHERGAWVRYEDVAALTAQLTDKDAALIEAHGLLDALGIAPAGVCHDQDCRTKLGHRLRALTAQLEAVQRERDEAVSAKDFHAARALRLQDAVIAAQAEATALREALAKGLAMLLRAATWPEHDNQGLRYHALETARDVSALLVGQPPTGGQP